MRYAVFILCFTLLSCGQTLKTGLWRGVLSMDGKELPFQFEVKKGDTLSIDIINGKQRIHLDEIKTEGDSIQIPMLVFDAQIRAQIAGETMRGVFIKNYNRSLDLPFSAEYGKERFPAADSKTNTDFSGLYDLQFDGDSKGVGIFKQEGNAVNGSILTPGGDYGFLQGNRAEGKMALSVFDGNHCYLLEAALEGDSLKGTLYSGKKAITVSGIKNPKARLNNASATVLKKGFSTLPFSFPDLRRQPVSNLDARFKNKVTVVQILGSWCPNCLDETRFLVPWYNENKNRGVEIVGLAFERKSEFEYAQARVQKLKDKMKVTYPLLIAGAVKDASASLPSLSGVHYFPTTVFIGKDGQVKHIETTFEGPATGIFYEEYKSRFNHLADSLLSIP